MVPQRRLKQLKTRVWFKPTRGGTKTSQLKDHPVKGLQHTSAGPRKENTWKVHGRTRLNTATTEPTGPSVKIKVIETPVFVPYTRDSKLRKALQMADDTLGECLNNPS